MRRALILLILALPLGLAAKDAAYEAAMTAFDRGDYVVAGRDLLPYAEGGDAEAQYRLGWMYEHAKGVWGDNTEARRWYQLAAAQGHSIAQAAIRSLPEEQGERDESGTSRADQATSQHGFTQEQLEKICAPPSADGEELDEIDREIAELLRPLCESYRRDASTRDSSTESDCAVVPIRVSSRIGGAGARCKSEVMADGTRLWHLAMLGERASLRVETAEVPPPPPYYAFREPDNEAALGMMQRSARGLVNATSSWGDISEISDGKVASFRASSQQQGALHCLAYLHDWKNEVIAKGRMRRWGNKRRSIVSYCETRDTPMSREDIEEILGDIEFVD